MGGDGSGRRPDPNKRFLEQAPVGNTTGGNIIIPDYSGVSSHDKTLTDLDARYDARYEPLGGGGAEVDPVFLALSTSLGYVATEADPVFMALSGAFLTAETDPIFIATSNAFVLDASANYQTLTDGSNADALHTHAGLGAESDPIYIATSGALPYVQIADSGAFLTSYTESDPVFLALSGSLDYLKSENWLAVSGSYLKTADNDDGWLLVSGAWNSHIADNTQAHSDYLINNGNDTTTGSLATTGDFDASGAGIFRNVIIDSTSGGYTASSFTQGSILMVYA